LNGNGEHAPLANGTLEKQATSNGIIAGNRRCRPQSNARQVGNSLFSRMSPLLPACCTGVFSRCGQNGSAITARASIEKGLDSLGGRWISARAQSAGELR
jgi:hypothetical protein